MARSKTETAEEILYFFCKCTLSNSHGITRMMLVVRIPHSDDIL